MPPLSSATFSRISTDLQEALEALSTLDVVSVLFGADAAVCQDDGSVSASVKFVTQHGDVPLLGVDTSLLVDDANGGVRWGMAYDTCIVRSFGCYTLRRRHEAQ